MHNNQLYFHTGPHSFRENYSTTPTPLRTKPPSSTSSSLSSSLQSPKYRSYRDNGGLDDIDERIFEYNNYNTNFNFLRSRSPSDSPVRDSILLRKNYSSEHYNPAANGYKENNNNGKDINSFNPKFFVDRYEPLDSPPAPDELLKLKWTDNSPRMSRLREHRSKRLLNRLEQFELWDAEQAQKQKQFELAREQRYNNIIERLKTQDFCLDQMRRRHENDIETSRELEVYQDEHFYVDPLDNPKAKNPGPVSQFRKFSAEMDSKLRALEDEIDLVNPKCTIEQTILPRLERTRENYSLEPDVFTIKGKKVLKRPNLTRSGESHHALPEDLSDEELLRHYSHYLNDPLDDAKCIKFYYPHSINDEEMKLEAEKETAKLRKLKPIIQEKHNTDKNSSQLTSTTPSNGHASDKKVCFEDDQVRKNNSTNNQSNNSKTENVNDTVDEDLASEMVVKTNLNENSNDVNSNNKKQEAAEDAKVEQ